MFQSKIIDFSMKVILKQFLKAINIELIIWITGLITLAFIDVGSAEHYSVCPLKNLGLDFCPGCGIGASIHYLFHFQFENSFNTHPLGIFALAVLLFRIGTLIKSTFINKPQTIR